VSKRCAAEQQEFDIDEMNSLTQLNELSVLLGGPPFSSDMSIESAKTLLWDFVEGKAENDIDRMCMGQLTGLWIELGGEGFQEGTSIEEARDIVWGLAEKSYTSGENGSCSGCSQCL
jgi:hypothetical protein